MIDTIVGTLLIIASLASIVWGITQKNRSTP